MISVIVPIYKVEKYLEKCIDSILSQSYKDLEVILVDDGSPDRCGEICDEYMKKDSRVKVIHKQNGGLSDARNAGIDIARGDYIGFVDSDDYLNPQMYEKLYNALIENNAFLSICGFDVIDENGLTLQITAPFNSEVVDAKYILSEICDLFDLPYVTAVNKLYKREVFDKLRFPVGKQNEDAAVIPRVVYRDGNIALVGEPLYYYLQRDGSIMHSDISVRSLDIIEWYYDCIVFLNEKGKCYRTNKICRRALGEYAAIRVLIKCKNRDELKRLKEIDKKLYIIYSKYSNRKNIIRTLQYRFPNILCFRMKLVKKSRDIIKKMKG